MLKKYIAEKKRIQSESENNNIVSDRDNSFHQDLSHDEQGSDFETSIVNIEQKHNRPEKHR